jgi:hypothetical protein
MGLRIDVRTGHMGAQRGQRLRVADEREKDAKRERCGETISLIIGYPFGVLDHVWAVDIDWSKRQKLPEKIFIE